MLALELAATTLLLFRSDKDVYRFQAQLMQFQIPYLSIVGVINTVMSVLM